MNETVSVFYACDDNFVKYTIVSLYSMRCNRNRDRSYDIHILHSGVSDLMKQKTLELSTDGFNITFDDVSEYLESVSDRLPIRDYYSKTTYYRFFISEMFPTLDKAVYIDSDTVVQGDISRLFDIEPGDKWVGACHEQAMVQVDTYGTYCERVVGVSRHNFFNAGLMLINCKKFREKNVLASFTSLLKEYNFVVTQDEDYLNLICKDHVLWLDSRWNTEIFGEIPYDISEAHILHYIMTSKPWHYKDCRYGELFWKYADLSSVAEEMHAVLEAYTDRERQRDAESCDRLLELARFETEREDNYLNRKNASERDWDRVEILKKIESYERQGRFDEDVEQDPPSTVLNPEDIEYLRRGLYKRFKTKIAYAAAHRFVYRMMDDKKLIINGIEGLENFKALESGAVVTCNHFNAFDSFAIELAYEAAEHKNRKFYRVIREGNYTSFPGFYGFLMRNCYTLPLSSNRQTMKKFMNATDTLLKDGNFVLVYPEQSMWWNYRKPKPLKKGAYTLAARNRVPVLPCFITMRDSDILGDDGFFVQEYTVHIGRPIYPDPSLPRGKQAERMMAENYEVWKNIYEKEYDIPLYYTTDIS